MICISFDLWSNDRADGSDLWHTLIFASAVQKTEFGFGSSAMNKPAQSWVTVFMEEDKNLLLAAK